MKSVFTFITRAALRFWVLTLLITLVIAALGVVGTTQMKLELIPSVSFPQTIVLAQASGMSSDEVMTVLTQPLEAQFREIPQVVNVESTTTGAFGSIITVRNPFGLNQDNIQAQIQQAINNVWLPLRAIQAPEGEDVQAFASRLLNDMNADVLVYLSSRDANFLFQLTPEVWDSLSPETINAVLSYMAAQSVVTNAEQSELRRIVDQDIIPQLEAMDIVARVSVGGGQVLPGEDAGLLAAAAATDEGARSLLLELSPEVWAVVSAKIGSTAALDESAVATFSATTIEVPTTPPALPESWQMDRFIDATDLLEMRGIRTLANVFNNFRTDGHIIGSLGQTNDLTPEVITQMLAIAPSMVNYFEAEQLVAMSDEVFAALPAEYIAGLDGFTRDAIAADALSANITGETAQRPPVNLPSAWRIAPPQLISFSFDDIPLATFSIFGTAGAEVTAAPTEDDTVTAEATTEAPSTDTTPTTDQQTADVPEGPALPVLLAVIGEQLGIQLDTADDLLNIQLPEQFASALGGASSLRAADFFNFLLILADPAALAQLGGGGTEGGAPAGGFDTSSINPLTLLSALNECNTSAAELTSGEANIAQIIIGCISPDAIAFVAENDATFIPGLQAEVFAYFSDGVLALEQVTPPLPDVWNTLAEQPQFSTTPLNTAHDLLTLGNGAASSVLNTINATVPAEFAGYEVRLFDSLTPDIARYLSLHEENFYANLDPDVLRKLSPQVLALLPQEFLATLDSALSTELTAIANGTQPPAIEALSSLYATDIAPADPNAPALNSDWELLANFYGIELDSADDFFRFPSNFVFPDAVTMWNGIFESPAGASFAVGLFGNFPVDAMQYILQRDPSALDTLRVEALQNLPDEVLAVMPQALQDRAVSSAEPFVPTSTVTRSNGAPSLQLTVYKTSDANTVEAFHRIDELLQEISAEDPNIDVSVVFEQASFIEESISGVAREGGLGGVFAIIMILLFLSNGRWARSPRRIAGAVMTALGLVLIFIATIANTGATGGDFGAAFAQINLVIQVPLVILLVAGILILIYPGELPYPAWRSTLVTAVSIPISVLMALALMHWLPPAVHGALLPYADLPLIGFILRLFPESITLNIMTLSGLTVAIGRVVDDSIVVLENIFRNLQEGGDKREAIIEGTRDVSIAIFAATVITVVVFLPLGLTGGLISEFFLPFGLAVTYSLMASFIVAITIVPVMAYLLINVTPEEEEHGFMERLYLPVLRWALSSTGSRLIVLAFAFASMVFGVILFAGRPAAFLPDFGEPQITVAIEMPSGTGIVETNAQALAVENYIRETIPADQIKAVETIVGGGGLSLASLTGGASSVAENQAQMTIRIQSPDELDRYTEVIRTGAEGILGEDHVTVSAASLSSQGFGSFALVVAGPQEELAALDATVLETLSNVPGLTNVSSTLSQISAAGGGDTIVTYLRVDGQSAVSYTGELESEDTLNVISSAKEAVLAIPNLPAGVTVSEGFDARTQTEGFASLFTAMAIAIAIVIAILIITFQSPIHWLDIMLSVVVAPVGAAILLTLTNRVLGISALIGLLMLIGIVVTNAVVLIDRVMTNRHERGMNVNDALIEAGGRRLRPILMTAFATIFALLPLAIGLSEGAIIASELGTVVIGGLFSSTLLTLIVVPVAYSILAPIHYWLMKLLGRKSETAAQPQSGD
jgi:multidrug efflux pump subunit AcrB